MHRIFNLLKLDNYGVKRELYIALCNIVLNSQPPFQSECFGYLINNGLVEFLVKALQLEDIYL